MNCLGAGALLAFGADALPALNNKPIERPIPSTGETVPIVGLGTNRYGVGNDATLRAPLRAALAAFHDLGGRVIDTAPGYKTSEDVLGDLMEDLGVRDDLFLATKVDREGRVQSRKRMEESFESLRTAQVDLMQVHSLRGWEDSLPVMREWKEDGRLRYIGITTGLESQYELMERIMKQEALDFIQINYSLAYRGSATERVIPLARDRNMAVIVNQPFGGGDVFEKLSGATLPAWAEEIDCESWAQFMLKYVLSQPAVTCAIPGMTKEHHVVDNMGAARGRMPNAAQRKRQAAFFAAL